MQMAGSGGWSGDGGMPFNVASDDWLTSGPGDDPGRDEFIAALEAFPGGVEDFASEHLEPSLDDLDQIFQQPGAARALPSMRTAFSMNDLQVYDAVSWNTRIVSVRPTLASVPEGGMPDPGPGHAGVNLLPLNAFQQQGEEPSAPDGAAMHVAHQPKQLFPPPQLFPSQLCSQPQPFMGQGMGVRPLAGTLMAGTSYHGAAGSAGMLQPQPALSTSPEYQMSDIVKIEEPCFWEADSTGGGQTAGAGPSTRLQPSGPALRKSQSALELGAWKKIAAGDLDFVDPSGSVREQLQGLDYIQQVGKLTPEERLLKILRYRAKRQMRNFNRTIKYQCRKSLADTRPRVRGRFARDNEPGSVLPHETKKAERERNEKSSAKPAASPRSSPSLEQQQLGLREGSLSPVSMSPVPSSELPQPDVQSLPALSGSASELGLDPARNAGLLEQHVSLAQLYNAWSETGSPAGQLKEGGQAPDVRVGPSSNSA